MTTVSGFAYYSFRVAIANGFVPAGEGRAVQIVPDAGIRFSGISIAG